MPAVEHQPEFAGKAHGFARKVRRRHEELELTEGELIRRTGLSRSYLQRLLNARGSAKDQRTGESKPPNPTLDVIWRLAEALEIDPTYLVDDTRGVETGLPRR